MAKHLRRLCWLICLPAAAFAQQSWIQGKVTYLAGPSVYTDIGRDAGAEQGDTLFSEKKKAVLIIQAISRRSSVAFTLDTTWKAAVGTKLLAHKHVRPVTETRDSLKTVDSIGATTQDVSSLWTGVITGANIQRSAVLDTGSSLSRPSQVNRVYGRVALQWYTSRDRENSQYNYHEPGGVINLSARRIQGSHFNLNTNVHVRKTYSDRTLRAANYPVRVYEMSLQYANEAVPYGYSVGRVSAPIINGIGYFDGAIYRHRVHPAWTLGGFAGSEPDYRKSPPQPSHTKVGFYAHYQQSAGVSRIASSVAFAGQYISGNIDREFVYLQNDLTLSPALSFYQNAEIGINRSDQARSSRSIELSNIYVMTRYRPIRTLTLTGSYDLRKNVFLIQTYKSIADTLFDDALRQGLRGEVNWRATRQLTLTVGSSVRTRKGDPKKTFLHSAGLHYNNVFRTQCNVSYRFSTTTTPYTDASSHAVGLSRQFGRLFSSAGFRTYRYQLAGRSTMYDRWSISFDGSLEVGRRVYASLLYEYSSGSDEKSDRVFMEMSYRF